jgi:hypothetical protein
MYEVKYKYNTVKLRIPDILPKGQYFSSLEYNYFKLELYLHIYKFVL